MWNSSFHYLPLPTFHTHCPFFLLLVLNVLHSFLKSPGIACCYFQDPLLPSLSLPPFLSLCHTHTHTPHTWFVNERGDLGSGVMDGGGESLESRII